MARIELFVGLKIPDTTAITAMNTLKKMGYGIERLKREIYYKFDIKDGTNEKKLSAELGKLDVLVNSNKNNYSIKLEKEELKKEDKAAYILVKDIGDKCEPLLKTLHKLGLSRVNSIEKGVLWTLYNASEKDAEEIAHKLLCNENYQEMRIL